MYKLFYTIGFLFCICSAHSQDFIYKHYDLQDGLPSPTIHSIFQDKEGFLWFGTESGLCRYDGARFKIFTVRDGLPDNEVFGMLQDNKGRIWLQQYTTSIAYIHNGKIYNQNNDSLLKRIKLASRVYGIAQDGEGNIGLCDNQTLYIILNGYKTIKTINSIDGQPFDPINLYTDSDGKLVVCTSTTLYKLENYVLRYKKRLAPDWLSPNDVLLHPAYTMNGYYDTLYLKDTAIYFRRPDRIIKYSAISDSVFSINTADGSYLFNINTQKLIKILPGIRVANTFIDREKNLWIGTEGKGIYKMGSQVIVNKKINENRNDISYIKKEEDKIIVGNNDAEMYEYAGNEFIKKDIQGTLAWDMRKVLYHEKINKTEYLLVHANGLMNYENGRVKRTRKMVMVKDANPLDQDHVLVSMHWGLCIVRKKDCEVIDTICHRKSFCSMKTNDSVLVGTPSGLFTLKEIGGKYFVADSLTDSSVFWVIKKSANNLIWAGTYAHGLYCMKNGKILRQFTDSLGLPSNNCRSLYIDSNDVWLGTDKGLVRITSGEEGFHIQRYSTSDGLPSNIINSIYVDGTTIYIGTPMGLCYFNETMIETTSICNLVLTGVRAGDAPIDLDDRYFFDSRQRFIIEYSGISFRSEQEMRYRYRINGIDDNWRNTSLSSLEFTALPYGDYELEIVAINKFGKESLPLKVQFHIKRPFYKTTWFIVLLVVLPGLLIFFYYKRRIDLAKKRQMQKLQQEVKIMELEQMALRAQMNPHFIFNCISTIQHLIMDNDTENIHKFVTSFSDLVRKTLDNAPELFISLNEEIKFLTSYFELERIRLEDRFSYIIDTTAIQHIDQWHVPNMVIQPFAENAIRHGVRYKKDGKGFIKINFEQQDTLLRCTVTDNGIGREKAMQLKQEMGIQHASKGMGLIFKRIDSLNAITSEKISITIEDLKDKDQKASGTKIIIDFFKISGYDKNSYNR